MSMVVIALASWLWVHGSGHVDFIVRRLFVELDIDLDTLATCHVRVAVAAHAQVDTTSILF